MSARVEHEPGSALPPGSLYVSQDNYGLVRPGATGYRYLYSDGATSCIIVALLGRSPAGEDLALLAHVGQPLRFQALFHLVAAHFAGPVRIWAQGANPPGAPASTRNARILRDWLARHTPERLNRDVALDAPPWFAARASLLLGQGHPSCHGRHACGLDLDRGTASRRTFRLTPEQRDPTGGLQTLFSVFGAAIPGCPPLWNAEEPFPLPVQRALAAAAQQAGWPAMARLSDAELLRRFSSTPQHEMPWFADTLRMSARLLQRFAS